MTRPRPPRRRPGLLLGTYRDLWATDVTKRNPALRFLMPKQKLELAAKDAEALELANGDAVTVSVNGHSVEARVAIRERMQPGAAFLIEGTDEANAQRARQRRPAADQGEQAMSLPHLRSPKSTTSRRPG